MNYEQKYKEALERAKDCHVNRRFSELDDTSEELCEYIFPELRESEDERMINKIIHTVTGYHPIHTTEEINSMVAYLENLKEEEGYEAIPVESTLEYKLGFKAGKESEKQKEQKPAEWSEEDEIDLNDAIKYVQNYGETSSDEYTRLRTKEIVDWLKSLRPQPKTELSEEDEHIISSILCLLHSIDNYNFDSWLKSLRPSWKPSKEQMDALKENISQDCVVCNGDRKWIKPNLESLYEQLKALM